MKSWILTDRQLCDCEMIMDKSFFPLEGFMNEDDYNAVITDLRLTDGSLFPIPITLDIDKNFSEQITVGEKIILMEKEGFHVAYMEVESIWIPDLLYEAQEVYDTIDHLHPAVDYIFNKTNEVYIGGKIKKIAKPNHYDYKKYRFSPEDAKIEFEKKGWDKIVAFQTRNPLHRAHIEMTMRTMEKLKASLFLHPAVGLTKPGDIDHFTRVRCYEHVLKRYPENSTLLALLPLAMRMGGPKEALLHAIIRKNYGCTHIIIGRDHAGPGLDSNGNSFYDPYRAQSLIKQYEGEIGIEMVPFQFMVYIPAEKKYRSIEDVKKGTTYYTLSGTQIRSILEKGEDIPEWFSYPEIATELKKTIPSLKKRGFTIFFTGLSGSGKSTIANGILIKLLENGDRPVTLLDGDIVRTHLSSELGFSKEHRSINVKRIGYVASEITKNGGVAVCAPIAPYSSDRKSNRKLISKYGGYIEVFVNTPLEICEERDSKGLYKLAREGKVIEFTGVSDPYEPPDNPEVIINSDGTVLPEDLVDTLYNKLIDLGYI